MRMQGRVAIVTGAAHPRGIGRGIAVAMAEENADLLLADIDGEGAEAIAQEIRAKGARAIALRTDVTREEEVKAMVDAALAEYGRIDVLVNDAGVSRHHEILEITSEEWDFVLNVNLKGAFLCTKAVLPTMIAQRYGRVVFIASMLGKWGAGPHRGTHYAASKAGIMGLAKSVARQMAPYGITSNAVSPGYVDTDLARSWETPDETAERRKSEGQAVQVPVGRLGSPADIADAVLFLASERASYVTGEILDVNGGAYMD